MKRPKNWTTDRAQIGPPKPFFVWFDVTGSADRDQTQGGQIDAFVVKTPNLATMIDDKVHCASVLRMMRRRGRSTNMPSSEACTLESAVAMCCRRALLSRSCCASTPFKRPW